MSIRGDGGWSAALVGQSVLRYPISGDDASELRKITSALHSTDITFTNLEATIDGRHGGWPMKTPLMHVGKPETLDDFAALGFNVLSLSNNHAFDLGPGGILSTLEEVRARGFVHAGTGKDAAEAGRPGIGSVRNGHTVGLVAADAGPPPGDHVYARDAAAEIPARPGSNRLGVRRTLRVMPDELAMLRRIHGELGDRKRAEVLSGPGFEAPTGPLNFYGIEIDAGSRYEEHREVDPADMDHYLGSIAETRSRADVVIAYVHHHHWEPVLTHAPYWMRDLAHRAIDAGANIFVSHGIPQLQGIEIYKGRPIFYSLGNFIFHNMRQKYYETRTVSWQSIIASCRFADDGTLSELIAIPILVGGKEKPLAGGTRHFAPVPAPKEHAEEILDRLARLSAEFGTEITNVNGVGVLKT